MAIGHYNRIYTGSGQVSNQGPNGYWGESNLAMGSENHVKGNQAVAMGLKNHVYTDNSGAVGRELILNNPAGKGGFVVGQYNDTTEYATGEDVAFVVGNGTSAHLQDATNALVVYHNGDVVVPERQGDIAMGNFGN